MTDLADPRPTGAGPSPRAAQVTEVADNVIALLRTHTKTRAQLMAAADRDVEWSARMLLNCLRHEGPMRAGALADCLRSDPSTVSRQVAALVNDGLIERRADPDDGRASLLALTPQADAALAEHDRIRLDYFARMLDGWSDVDLSRFAGLLDRFTRAYEAANGTLLNERIATRSARTGSRI